VSLGNVGEFWDEQAAPAGQAVTDILLNIVIELLILISKRCKLPEIHPVLHDEVFLVLYASLGSITR